MIHLKKWLLLFIIININTTLAQDVIVIPGGIENAGLLEKTIMEDITERGERKNPNRIYELENDEIYYQKKRLDIFNPYGVLTIRGRQGGKKPIIVPAPDEDPIVGTNVIYGNFTLENVHWQGKALNNQISWSVFSVTGTNHFLHVQDCLFEFCNGYWFHMNNVTRGAKISIKNCYFRDLFHPIQWFASRIVECMAPIDSFIFENNTITGAGVAIGGQENLLEYAVINHNTFINTHRYIFLGLYWKEVYITNNLFVNANMAGEDFENFLKNPDTNPDQLLSGICGIDTIENTLNIQKKFLNADNSLTEEVDELTDIIYYAADNIVTYSPELDDYYHGGYNEIGDYPVSYLNWWGNKGTFQVHNVPSIWYNERSQNLVDTFANIVDENNHIYDIPLANLGMVTNPLDETGAEIFIQWNRSQWDVPGVHIPADYNDYLFGDEDPNTIPGDESENGMGIINFTDMPEDFSYTANYKSQSDGHSIGALHWTNEIDSYDSETSLNSIKTAYLDAVNNHDLAVFISDFSAESGQAGITLTWTTVSETDNYGFIIDRSDDNQQTWRQIAHFKDHDALKGQGNCNISTQYSYLDVTAPLSGNPYYRLSDVDMNGTRTTHESIKVNYGPHVPGKTHLDVPYPNPFNPVTRLNYELEQETQVTITVYNLLGCAVKQLYNNKQVAGSYRISWNGTDDYDRFLPSGTYFIRLQTDNFSQVQKILYLK